MPCPNVRGKVFAGLQGDAMVFKRDGTARAGARRRAGAVRPVARPRSGGAGRRWPRQLTSPARSSPTATPGSGVRNGDTWPRFEIAGSIIYVLLVIPIIPAAYNLFVSVASALHSDS
jgi:hypothetical protein